MKPGVFRRRDGMWVCAWWKRSTDTVTACGPCCDLETRREVIAGWTFIVQAWGRRIPAVDLFFSWESAIDFALRGYRL